MPSKFIKEKNMLFSEVLCLTTTNMDLASSGSRTALYMKGSFKMAKFRVRAD